MPISISDKIRKQAFDRGFDACRLTSVVQPWMAGEKLLQFLGEGRHGTMTWMSDTAERRQHPRAMWPEARSAIVLGMNYGPETNPLDDLDHRDRGTVSVYARGRDYHELVKGRLKQLAGWLQPTLGGELKVFVDTAPLMEKPLAAQSGLGWQGKHTNLVSREFGSWLFLGVILTSLELEPDPEGRDHCGACRACLDVCPTKAFPAPYQLDARRCIAYLTIEHAGPVEASMRPALGNRIFGCDDCLAVCPWNKFADASRHAALQTRRELFNRPLTEYLGLDDASFRSLFSNSPVKRLGHSRFLRNVLYATGNSAMPQLATSVLRHVGSPEPVVAEAAIWALERLDQASSSTSLAMNPAARSN